MKSILFTFDNDTDRSKFVNLIRERLLVEGEPQTKNFVESVLSSSMTYDPCVVHPEHRHCSVWVSGNKLVEGDFKSMNNRFDQECGVHSATVSLRELRGTGEWREIRSRRRQ